MEAKICKYCGKEFFVYRHAKTRLYCSQECANIGRRKKFTTEDIEYLKKNYRKYGGRICARRFGISASCLYSRLSKHRNLYGPIKFEKDAPAKEPVDIKTEYSQAWIECGVILNQIRNQTQHGKVG